MIKRFLTFGLSLGVSSMILSTTNLLVADSSKVVLPPSWTTTRITYDITVEELAQRYYGNSKDYKLILKANKKILRGRHTVPKNTEIKIPITEKFRDQPEQLGWND
jgi:phage tail protein X